MHLAIAPACLRPKNLALTQQLTIGLAAKILKAPVVLAGARADVGSSAVCNLTERICLKILAS